MKKLFLCTVLLLEICFSASAQKIFENFDYTPSRPRYVGQPIEEYKELSKIMKDKAIRENNEKIQIAVNKFLEYEESAYSQLNYQNLKRENYAGFIFYYEKADKCSEDAMFIITDSENKPILHPLSKMVEKKWCDLNYSAGYCYLFLDKFQEAKTVLGLCPDHYESTILLKNISNIESAKNYSEIGNKKMNIGDFSGALNDFSKEIEISASASGYYNRANARISLSDTLGAKQDWARAIELNPNFSMAYNNLAYTYLLAKQYEIALVNANKAIELDGSNSTAFGTRGEIKFYLRDYLGSLSDCTISISLSTSANANLFFVRGRDKFKLKDTTGACEDWNIAKGLGENEAGKFINQYCK